MLDEELARAVLIGDGRDVADEDKIKDPAGATEGAGIRAIVNDHELYVANVYVNIDDANSDPTELTDEIVRSLRFYKGSGSPTFYTTLPTLTYLLLARDKQGRRLYRTAADLAAELGVANVVTVEVMEDEDNLLGIIVNLKDYTIGADKGGDVNFFDDFDIDYNQYKYLLETRVSGALTKIRSALVISKVPAASVLATPKAPTFTKGSGVISIPTVTGVTYKDESGTTVTTAAPPAPLAAGDSETITAHPASAAYYFESDQDDEWTFEK
jgi:hypothetical protein